MSLLMPSEDLRSTGGGPSRYTSVLSLQVMLSQHRCMNRAISIPLALQLVLVSCGRNISTWQPSGESPIIPIPAHSSQTGTSFSIGAPVRISVSGPGADLFLPSLNAWVEERSSQLGTPFLQSAAVAEANVTITIGDNAAGDDESYRLDSEDGRVRIDAGSPAGAFYGLQTLRQLFAVDDEGRVFLPSVHVADMPRFSYRGMHLDVGRHFFPVEFVKRYVDLLASYKMNRFHWHLTEDQGWRIQIDSYPKLTSVASCRAETIVERNFDPFVGDGEEYCGFYTKDEIREVVAYAAERFVTVIPEIEMPGHSLAALAAYPALSCTGGPFEVGTRWGVYEDIYCPSEETFAFLESVLDEVMDLFPGEYIHIGGDEAPKSTWEASELAQSVIRREGLADEHELQSYFIRRIETYLNSHGRKLIGWDEILEGGLAPDATVMSWRGTQGGIEAARRGHDVIMTPGSHMYFDHYQGKAENEPLAIGGFNPLENVYSFEPVPEELSSREATHVLGGQANVWTEYMLTADQVEYMAYPRALALSEVLWSPREARDWDSFVARLPRELEQLDRRGVNYRLPDVTGLERDQLTLEDFVVVELGVALSHAPIHYTLDGTDPDLTSPRYEGPFQISPGRGTVTVRARAFLTSGRATAPASATFRRVSPQVPHPILRSDLSTRLLRKYFEDDFHSVDELISSTPLSAGPAAPEHTPAKAHEHFGLTFDGYLHVPEEGIYEFTLASDDGSRLMIGSEIVVDHDGLHGMTERQGQIALQQGFHTFHLSYFQAAGGAGLSLRIQAPGWAVSRPIPSDWLFHLGGRALYF